MTTEHLNNLADALENIAHMEYPSDHHDRKNLAEAARILRAADAVDVAGLMAMVRRYGDDNWMGNDDTNKLLSEIESALRMALAAERQAAIQHACDVATAKCAEISEREHRDFKGLNPDAPPGKRGNSYVEGLSDGADLAGDAIKEALK